MLPSSYNYRCRLNLITTTFSANVFRCTFIRLLHIRRACV
jgi:hypothetical protein